MICCVGRPVTFSWFSFSQRLADKEATRRICMGGPASAWLKFCVHVH